LKFFLGDRVLFAQFFSICLSLDLREFDICGLIAELILIFILFFGLIVPLIFHF